MTPTQPLPVDEEHARLVQDLTALAQTGELLVEDFAIVHARYSRLLVAGWAFTSEFRLLMKLLSVQARYTDDDPDSDRCVDDGQEDDQENEDDEQYSSAPVDIQVHYEGAPVHRHRSSISARR